MTREEVLAALRMFDTLLPADRQWVIRSLSPIDQQRLREALRRPRGRPKKSLLLAMVNAYGAIELAQKEGLTKTTARKQVAAAKGVSPKAIKRGEQRMQRRIKEHLYGDQGNNK